MSARNKRICGRRIAVGTGKALLAFVLLYPPIFWFQSRFLIGIDAIEGEGCLPFTVFLIDTRDQAPKRGDHFAFRARGMTPFYPDGTLVVKAVAGVPGDRVRVSGQGVEVNGENRGELVHARPGGKLYALNRRESEYARDERVPPGKVWAMGTHPRSFDSRYWGYVDLRQQGVGRAYAIW